MKFSIKNYISEHNNILSKINEDGIEKIVDIIYSVHTSGKKIITCGNGGSASTASHMITDWNKMTTMATGKKLYGFSLTDNVGLITAYANDTNYENVFKGQLESIMDKGDCLVAISGSGQSKNVINAVEYANKIGGLTIGILGFNGGELKKIIKNSVVVPSNDMQICEDVHLMICHMVMKKLCNYDIITD
jgi:D-sedoheptulose 7-phosphate isomerase